ncbi:MAG: hypothetical protein HETSPECPRED_009985 [Heterodermia speciosa]|uniref:Uncharacterized protein n=1 Tax=Heterodermia speciosa TaxID=116794 RepID=A0A8H3G4I3_9LECA|nr:MAG: hypothetical protein HETSPECPRED_009985 [Heterodermia speciosa]
MAARRSLSCPETSQSVTNTHPGCPLQDSAKPGFCPSCYSQQQREFRELQIDLGHLGELMEIIRKKHEDELRAVSGNKESMLKKQEELNVELRKWLDHKFLEISVNETIKAKMLAALSLL